MDLLSRKNRGGKNNENGVQYEFNYATVKIVKELEQYLTTGKTSTVFFTQVKEVLVDDFLIKTNEYSWYHQLKNVKYFSWSTVKKDFETQISLFKRENIDNYKLVLVFSDNSFNDRLITDLHKHIEFEYFTNSLKMNLIIHQTPLFKKALRNLSVIDNPTDDHLYGIAQAILGIWASYGDDRHKGISLETIITNLNKCVNTRLNKNVIISNECKSILDIIPGFKYSIKGNEIIWSINNSLENSTDWTKDLEEKIILANPTTRLDIFKLL